MKPTAFIVLKGCTMTPRSRASPRPHRVARDIKSALYQAQSEHRQPQKEPLKDLPHMRGKPLEGDPRELSLARSGSQFESIPWAVGCHYYEAERSPP